MHSPITSHVLDTRLGRPAHGIEVTLEVAAPDSSTLQEGSASGWRTLGSSITDGNGRIAHLLPSDFLVSAGVYRMRFVVGSYFAAQSVPHFYPEVVIYFEITSPQEHYHIPLLISPFAYSTYRGS